MKRIRFDKDIAKELGVTTADIIYHFKKGHIKGTHLKNVGWLASKNEANKFIKDFLRNKREIKTKKQKTLFNYKETKQNEGNI